MKAILKLIVIVLLAVISFNVGILYANITEYASDKDELLDAYEWYYIATEDLLDTIEDHYNWVDAIDSYDYYYWANIIEEMEEQ